MNWVEEFGDAFILAQTRAWKGQGNQNAARGGPRIFFFVFSTILAPLPLKRIKEKIKPRERIKNIMGREERFQKIED